MVAQAAGKCRSWPIVCPKICLCYGIGVKYLSAITRLLSLFAILGLILSPLAKPAMAMDPSAPAAMDHHAGMAMDASAMGDMPCCPDQGQNSDCAKDCPLMAACTISTLQNVSSAAGPVVFFTLARVTFPVRVSQLEGLTASPSPRPPNA
jgi:hypothetical protein